MKLHQMALGTHFVNSKHDQNVAVSMDIIITVTGRLAHTIRRRALSAFQHICSVIRSNSNTSNSDAGKKDQNSL